MEDGFTLLALHGDELAGMISVYWKELPAPLAGSCEAYIDILEVHKDFRRQGIAARLIGLSAERARAQGAIQLRSWSSLDKQEAIPMWKALGFGLCPADSGKDLLRGIGAVKDQKSNGGLQLVAHNTIPVTADVCPAPEHQSFWRAH